MLCGKIHADEFTFAPSQVRVKRESLDNMKQGEIGRQSLFAGYLQQSAALGRVADDAIDRNCVAGSVANPAAQQCSLSRSSTSFGHVVRTRLHAIRTRCDDFRMMKTRGPHFRLLSMREGWNTGPVIVRALQTGTGASIALSALALAGCATRSVEVVEHGAPPAVHGPAASGAVNASMAKALAARLGSGSGPGLLEIAYSERPAPVTAYVGRQTPDAAAPGGWVAPPPAPRWWLGRSTVICTLTARAVDANGTETYSVRASVAGRGAACSRGGDLVDAVATRLAPASAARSPEGG